MVDVSARQISGGVWPALSTRIRPSSRSATKSVRKMPSSIRSERSLFNADGARVLEDLRVAAQPGLCVAVTGRPHAVLTSPTTAAAPPLVRTKS